MEKTYKGKISFLLGSPDIGGGTYVIFQHATWLSEHGWHVTIIRDEKTDLKRLDWFPKAKDLNWETLESVENKYFDLCVVTWWKTTLYLDHIKTHKFIYFVQSIESKFPDKKDLALIKYIESTYILEFKYITEASWIRDYLFEKYKQEATLVRNGIDKIGFSTSGHMIHPKLEDGVRVIVEGPIDVKFKNVSNTIKIATRSKANEVWLLTTSDIQKYPGVDRIFSKIPIGRVGEIYRACDILLKLSYVEGMFGPPLEMFHCGGTAVVYKVTGYDEYIEDGINAYAIDFDKEEEVLARLNELIDDKKQLMQFKKNALKTAEKWPDWKSSSSAFETEIYKLFKENFNNADHIKKKQKFLFDCYVEYHTLLKSNKRIQLLHRIKERLKKSRFHNYLKPFYVKYLYVKRFLRQKFFK